MKSLISKLCLNPAGKNPAITDRISLTASECDATSPAGKVGSHATA